MFESKVYVNRRRALLEKMAAMNAEGSRGIAVFLGNVDAPANYRGNDYKFRQDSSFLYFWGVDEPFRGRTASREPKFQKPHLPYGPDRSN